MQSLPTAAPPLVEADSFVKGEADSIPRGAAMLIQHPTARRLGLAYGLSAALHALAVAILGAVVVRQSIVPPPEPIEVRVVAPALVELQTSPLSLPDQTAPSPGAADASGGGPSAFETFAAAVIEPPVAASMVRPSIAEPRGFVTRPSDEPLLVELDGLANTALAQTRSDSGRRAAVRARGGTPESEAAVARALEWLARHQYADGSWNFDHREGGRCRGKCGQPGSMTNARVAATALALLPFLGAGETHRQGKYRRPIESGLRFIVANIQPGPEGSGDLTQGLGTMYQHGLASIALTEAYAMTEDRQLIAPAQALVRYIVLAQDPKGGGWRYFPRSPGDTSVVGWQLMALKSAQLAYLEVPPETFDGVTKFLDSVARDGGSGYGYMTPLQGTPATDAVGLLCRMYLGWPRDRAELAAGVRNLALMGPSPDNMYYNYYATQVLHHYEGPTWEPWNTRLREHLVATQSKVGHEAGSWYFEEKGHSNLGGRLYSTALATMILEVYYRHMPLYSRQSVAPGAPP